VKRILAFVLVLLAHSLVQAQSKPRPILFGEGFDRQGTRVVIASIYQTYRYDLDKADLILEVQYLARGSGAAISPCASPKTGVVAVFVVGQKPVAFTMSPVCNEGMQGRAVFRLSKQDQPGYWNEIFPTAQRMRLEVAFTTNHAMSPSFPWDSDYGGNYKVPLMAP
jgi:hypothetical protein